MANEPRAPQRASTSRPGTNRPPDAPPMSVAGIRTGCLHSTLSKLVLFLLLGIFAVGAALSSFGPSQPLDGGAGDGGAGATQAVARVGDTEISGAELSQSVARQEQFYQQMGQVTPVAGVLPARSQALLALGERAALYQAAQADGFSPSGADIDQEINKQIDEALKGQEGTNPAAIRRQLEAQNKTLESYCEELKGQFDRDAIAEKIAIDRLEKKIKDANPVSETEYKQSVTKLKLRQIIVRPSLAAAKDEAARSKAESDARARADKLVAQLGTNPNAVQFAALAKTSSDDTLTKTRGGDLGGFKLPAELGLPPVVRDELLKSPKNLVGPVQDETTKDFYIVLIEGRQLALPKDYAQKKATYFKTYEDTRDNEAWQKYQDELRAKTTVETIDPALNAYRVQTGELLSAKDAEAKTLRQQAIDGYEEALRNGASGKLAAIQSQLAQLYASDPPKRLQALKNATESAPDDASLRLDYARDLQSAKRNADAIAQLQAASKALDSAPSPQFNFGGNPNDTLRFQIAAQFDQLGKKDLAGAERKKVKPSAAPGAGGFGGFPGGVQMIPSQR